MYMLKKMRTLNYMEKENAEGLYSHEPSWMETLTWS